jgi:pyridoxamine 5'-phosphate oxidase
VTSDMSSSAGSTPAGLAGMRREYPDLTDDALAHGWPEQFARWLADAVAAGVPEPNAMVLATADAAGRPSARSVLLKGYDESGFTFFTNYNSRKGRELAVNPGVSLVFPWYALHRQVVVCGRAERVDRAETEAYFAVRPRGAQLAAWASHQSATLQSRDELERAWQHADGRFPDEVPAPEHWGGFRVRPDTVEFWQGRRSRMHDRLRFRRDGRDGWLVERLSP